MKSRLVGALCALLLPAPALSEPAPADPEYDTVYDSYNAAVFTTGTVLFTASYGASVVAAASASNDNSDRGFDRLFIPVAGPWLALADRGDCPITSSSCDDETTTKVLLVADAIFQAAGVLAMIDGLVEPSSHRVPLQSAKVHTRRDTKLSLTPVSVKGNPGLAVVGRF